MDFHNLRVIDLRKLVQEYNKHYTIKGYYKLNKTLLIKLIKKYMKIENGIIKVIINDFTYNLPEKKKINKKRFEQKLTKILKQIKKFKESIPTYDINKYQPLKKSEPKQSDKIAKILEQIKEFKESIPIYDINKYQPFKKSEPKESLQIEYPKQDTYTRRNKPSKPRQKKEKKEDEDVTEVSYINEKGNVVSRGVKNMSYGIYESDRDLRIGDYFLTQSDPKAKKGSQYVVKIIGIDEKNDKFIVENIIIWTSKSHNEWEYYVGDMTVAKYLGTKPEPYEYDRFHYYDDGNYRDGRSLHRLKIGSKLDQARYKIALPILEIIGKDDTEKKEIIYKAN